MRDKVIFISDIHFQGVGDDRERSFLRFLDEQAPTLKQLVIAGDLFDFWIGYQATVYHPYLPVLNRLSHLCESGVRIDYIEGNHDFHLGAFFRETLKCNIYEKEARLQLDDKTVLVSHGDLVNKRDYGYRFLRFILRTKIVQFVIRQLHPDWIWKIGHRASGISSHFIPRQNLKTQQLYSSHAKDRLSKSDADVLIMGHNHCPDEQLFDISGQKKAYYNCGDWLFNFSYVEYVAGTFQLKRIPFTLSGQN